MRSTWIHAELDNDNIHVAIAVEIAAELRKLYPKFLFQVFGPSNDLDSTLKQAFTHANVSFSFAKIRNHSIDCGKPRSINHSGVIKIDNGSCFLRVKDPGNMTATDPDFYVLDEFPLESPDFPDSLYAKLTEVLDGATAHKITTII